MGVNLVPLPELQTPLAPGTPAFSILPKHGCSTHVRRPCTLPQHMGIVRADGKVKMGNRNRLYTYKELYASFCTFFVSQRTITTARCDTKPVAGDTVVAFDVSCGCRPHPFTLISPGWSMAGGIEAEHLNHKGLKPYGFSPIQSSWLLVQADWNQPVHPSELRYGERVVLFDLLEGKTSRRMFHAASNGSVSFADGREIDLKTLGVSYWLFQEA